MTYKEQFPVYKHQHIYIPPKTQTHILQTRKKQTNHMHTKQSKQINKTKRKHTHAQVNLR